MEVGSNLIWSDEKVCAAWTNMQWISVNSKNLPWLVYKWFLRDFFTLHVQWNLGSLRVLYYIHPMIWEITGKLSTATMYFKNHNFLLNWRCLCDALVIFKSTHKAGTCFRTIAISCFFQKRHGSPPRANIKQYIEIGYKLIFHLFLSTQILPINLSPFPILITVLQAGDASLASLRRCYLAWPSAQSGCVDEVGEDVICKKEQN